MYDARPERGTKRVCLHCEAKFYDLIRFPILCPKCGTEYVEVVRPPPPPRQPRRSAFGRSRDNPPPEAREPEENVLDSPEEERDEDEADEEADADGEAEETED